jgi:hypothetical protein
VNIFDDLALYYQEYTIHVGGAAPSLLYDSTVSMATTLYHELLHIWFTHWALNPRSVEDSMGVISGDPRPEIKYKTGHLAAGAGQIEKLFQDMETHFRGQATSAKALVK